MSFAAHVPVVFLLDYTLCHILESLSYIEAILTGWHNIQFNETI